MFCESRLSGATRPHTSTSGRCRGCHSLATVAAKRELGIGVVKGPLTGLTIAVQGRVRCCGCKAVGPFLINREDRKSVV